jgi:hypothetical protein
MCKNSLLNKWCRNNWTAISNKSQPLPHSFALCTKYSNDIQKLKLLEEYTGDSPYDIEVKDKKHKP